MTARSSSLAPRWLTSQNTCGGCGYDLAGLPEGGLCPECGLPYAPNALVLPATKPTIRTEQTRTPIARLRRYAIALYIVLVALLMQGFIIFIFMYGFIAGLIVLAAVVAAGIGLYMTGKPADRYGKCELHITSQGVTIRPLEKKKRESPAEPEFHPWPDEPLSLFIKRAGPWWAKLTIKARFGRPLLVAGVGLPQEQHQHVHDYINACINREPLPNPPQPVLPW